MADVSEPQDPDQPAGDVGSVGDEAAKLLGALTEWAKDSGGEVGAGLGATLSGLSGLTGLAAGKLGEVNDHIATGAPECTYCPVCRTVHALRETSPEVKAHLASAASSFFQAVASVLATVPPPGPGGSGPTPGSGAGGLEKIDLDGDDEND